MRGKIPQLKLNVEKLVTKLDVRLRKLVRFIRET